MNIEATIKNILLKFLDVEGDIAPSASMTEDLGANSVEMVEIFMAIEQAFGLTITEEQSESIGTVQDAIDFVQAALARQQS